MGPQAREPRAFAAMGNFKPDRENPLLRRFPLTRLFFSTGLIPQSGLEVLGGMP